MKSQPLTETELDQLSAVLARFGDERSMNLEQLDGFLAALICGPELVAPSKYLPEMWGDQTVFEDTSSAQVFIRVMLHYGPGRATSTVARMLLPHCPSADDLRLSRRFEKGGSGSSGLEFKRPAADAASGGLRWLYA
jgi:uncharacterized protein